MSTKILFGFHAVAVRLKTAPDSIVEIHVDASRRDARMRQFVERAQAAGAKLVDSDDDWLIRLAGSPRHQGVVARVTALVQLHSIDDVLDQVSGPPLVLVLDGVTDPHNLGACLRVADGAGAHAVLAPKDHAVGLNATVAKVASGAAETVPYLMVTNLARSLNELKDRDIQVIGTAEDAELTIYDIDLTGPVALVLGAEGAGLRADAQDLRPAGAHPDGRCGGKSQRLGGLGRLLVRGAAPAPAGPTSLIGCLHSTACQGALPCP